MAFQPQRHRVDRQMKSELGATIQNLQKSTSPCQKALDPTTSAQVQH